jgi:predicted metal-dependent peptidase
LKVKERTKKAKIQLQSRNPFFSYLSLFLDFKESEELPEYAGMGVNEKGELFYKKEFIEKLSDEELISTISHEILHLSFLHLIRLKDRDKLGWNISTDIVSNSLLNLNNFQLPKGCLVPDWNNKIIVGETTIEKCNEKTAEQVYNELPKEYKQPNKKGYYVVVDENGNSKKGFDEHIESKNLTKKEQQELKEKWNERVCNAYVNAKQRGQLPNGIERLVGNLHKEKIDWKSLLRRYIINQIPSYSSWNKRNKKSRCLGVYLPDRIKEKIEVGIVIDCSGSIGKKELTDFLSEIVGIAKAYKNQIDMILYTHDSEVHTEYKVENGNIDKIMKMEIKGGGGTSHKVVWKYIEDKNYKPQIVIALTDGYSDISKEDKPNYPLIWVVSPNGANDNFFPFGIILRLDN